MTEPLKPIRPDAVVRPTPPLFSSTIPSAVSAGDHSNPYQTAEEALRENRPPRRGEPRTSTHPAFPASNQIHSLPAARLGNEPAPKDTPLPDAAQPHEETSGTDASIAEPADRRRIPPPIPQDPPAETTTDASATGIKPPRDATSAGPSQTEAVTSSRGTDEETRPSSTRRAIETIYEPTDQQNETRAYPDPVSLNVTLTTNPLLEELLAGISTTAIDWERIKALSAQFNDIDPSNIFGILGEMHLRDTVMKLAEPFGDRIKFDPISDKTTAQNFHFRVDRKGRLSAYTLDKRHQTDQAEYDLLTEIDGLPVIWESKLSPSSGSGLIKPTFMNSYLNRISAPLQAYYQRNDFAFVLVTLPESLQLPKSNQQAFLENGGKHIAIPTSIMNIRLAGLQVQMAKRRSL